MHGCLIKKKIVHIISSLKRGGAETVLLDLTQNLSMFHHTILYIHDGPIRLELEKNGIQCIALGDKWYMYPFIFFKLRNLLKILRPDVIHSSLWAANFFTRWCVYFLKIPHIAVIHAYLHHQGFIRIFLDIMTFYMHDTIVVVSEGIYHSLCKKWWINTSKIILIENGINVNRATHIVTRSSILPDDKSFIIGAVGRFIPAKNFSLLIKSFALIRLSYPSIRLMLIGSGPEQEKLKALINRLGIQNHVHIIMHKNAIEYYQLFNCFVQPSATEGLSIALLEAMSFGLPCIVTSREQQHDVIEHQKTGLIIPYDDKQALQDAVAYCYGYNREVCEMGIRAKHLINKRFTSTIMAHKYEQLFIKKYSN